MIVSGLLIASVLAGHGLLPTAQLRKSEGVTRAAGLTDGKATWDGDNWDVEPAAVIGKAGVVEWDLGEVMPVAAGLLQGDNNDDYLIEGSEDGAAWTTVWRPEPDVLAGLRTRTTKTLKAKARYLRLTASGGDGLYSVTELQLFKDAAELTDTTLERRPRPPPPPVRVDRGWLVVAAVTGLMIWFFSDQKARKQRALINEKAPAAAADEVQKT